MNRLFKSFFVLLASFGLLLGTGCSSPSDSPALSQTPPSSPTSPSNPSGSTLPEGQSIDLSSSEITASAIVDSMKFGWNLGNTLDANEDKANWSAQKNGTEIDWGLANTASDALFKKLYDSGLRTVRIPISWHNHVDSNLNINSAWMAHVKNIVDMACSKGLYVIINIHHDNYNGDGLLGTKPGFSLFDGDKIQSELFVSKIWTQIATTFINYDGHLVFETLNEPRVVGGSHEWNCTNNSWTCSECQKYFAIINSLNQKAVDAIRATGGNNAKRLIMFPAYVAAPYAAINAKKANIFKVPADSATNRLALSVHMYTPYNFAMNPTGHSDFTNSDKSELTSHFTSLNETFISKGIPVVIGEMGATNRNNFEARKSWFTYYLDLCKTYKVAAVLWDNGNETNPSEPNEAFGYMNRKASGGPAWFTGSRVSELIAAAVEARGVSGDGGSSGSDPILLWTGSQDLKHWNGNDSITLENSKFSSAAASSKIRFTISKGAECTATDCTNNYSTIHPITAWPTSDGDTSGFINFPEANSTKQLSVTPPASESTTVTITPDSASWAAIKAKGLIVYGHKVTITKLELL